MISGGDGYQGKEEPGLQTQVMTPGRDRLWVLLGRVADEPVLILRSNQMVTVLRRMPVATSCVILTPLVSL